VKFRLTALVLLAAAMVVAPGAAAAGWQPPAQNPCEGPRASQLLCPNLRIGPPSEMYSSSYGGKALLHATSDVRSRGRGPIEVHGQRNGPKSMKVTQRIYKVGGGHLTVRTGASLHFTDVGAYFGGSYWKVHQLARFQLRPVLPDGSLGEVVRMSPKLNYCLRDLERTRPGRRSPSHAFYPACNQDPRIKHDRLGTSVGWSDIYPADYDKQYIDVSGLRGCFAFTMTVDPRHHLFEADENDNSSHRRIALPYTGASC
jgi:Lysyl oxidase